VSADYVLALFAGVLKVTLIISGPLLLAALVGGLFVGIIQTATQINEPSIAFVVKCTAVIVTLLLVGPYAAQKAISYTRDTFGSVAQVVR
jgi:flagellar biosynthetic protein FliQ